MRIALLLFLLGSMISSPSSDFTVPKKFRGQYRCELPAYEIMHDGGATIVEPTTVILLVYESKIVLRIKDKSFSTYVDKKGSSKGTLSYSAKFQAPFSDCVIAFRAKPKSVEINLPMFDGVSFIKVK